jgi:RHS repeat-associated protein
VNRAATIRGQAKIAASPRLRLPSSQMTAASYTCARYYDPQVGRFLSEDPIRFWGGIDFFKYAANSSPNATDPSGKWVFYGNWCGPDWTGARTESYDPSHDILVFHSTDWKGDGIWVHYYAPPIDGLDAACETHDKCYYSCRAAHKCDKKGRADCMRQCNYALSSEAASATTDNPIAAFLLQIEMALIPPSDSLVGPDDKSCTCGK